MLNVPAVYDRVPVDADAAGAQPTNWKKHPRVLPTKFTCWAPARAGATAATAAVRNLRVRRISSPGENGGKNGGWTASPRAFNTSGHDRDSFPPPQYYPQVFPAIVIAESHPRCWQC